MLGICLSALMSGVISTGELSYSLDTNNGVLFTHENRTEYVLAHKFNLVQLCDKNERFAENSVEPYTLIKTLE